MAKPKEMFTAQVLRHIQIWAKHCEQDKNYYWTKWDSEIFFLIETEIKLLLHENYINKKIRPITFNSKNKLEKLIHKKELKI